MNKFNKIGKVKITKEFIEDLNFEQLSFLYSIIHPVKIDWRYDCCANMICISKYFDLICEGDKIPEYELKVRKEWDGKNSETDVLYFEIMKGDEIMANICNNPYSTYDKI